MSFVHCINQDIFSVHSDMLLNPVNCKGVSGAGLALAFKRKFPAPQREYEATCRKDMWITDPLGVKRKVAAFRPGDLIHLQGVNVDLVSESTTLEDLLHLKQHIVYFPTKNHYKDPSKYEYVETGLNSLVTLLTRVDGVEKVSIPALGCGLGGLDWKIVEGMIVERLRDVDKTFLLFPPQ
jgi:O-acetyl-ADP-ribose deacetylase (regulator of RNase III)